MHRLRVLYQGVPPGSQGRSAIPSLLSRSFSGKTQKIIACLAPSFPAAFPQAKPGQIISAVKRLGFTEVMEVAFGADLVAKAHARWAKTQWPKAVYFFSLPGARPLHQKVLSLPGAQLDPNRFPDGGHGPGDQAGLPARGQGGLHRALHRQESGDRRSRGCGGRRCGPHLRGTGPDVPGGGPGPGEASGERPRWAVPRLGRIFPVPGGLLRSASLKEDICRNQILVTEGKEACTQILQRASGGRGRGQISGPSLLRGLHQRAGLSQRALGFRPKGVGGQLRPGAGARSEREDRHKADHTEISEDLHCAGLSPRTTTG